MTSTIPATVADLLDRSADRINRYGLHKHDPFDMHGWRGGTIEPRHTAVCADAAISIAGGWLPSRTGDEVKEAAVAAAARWTFADGLVTQGIAVRVCYHRPGFCRDVSCFDAAETIAVWNDHPDRTKQQVVAEFRACAVSLRVPAEAAAGGTPMTATVTLLDELRDGLTRLADQWRRRTVSQAHIQQILLDWRPDVSSMLRWRIWEEFANGNVEALDELTVHASSSPSSIRRPRLAIEAAPRGDE